MAKGACGCITNKHFYNPAGQVNQPWKCGRGLSARLYKPSREPGHTFRSCYIKTGTLTPYQCYLYLPGYRLVFACTDLFPFNAGHARHQDGQIGKKKTTKTTEYNVIQIVCHNEKYKKEKIKQVKYKVLTMTLLDFEYLTLQS